MFKFKKKQKGKPNRVKQIYGDRFPRAGSISKWYGSTTLSKIIVFVKVNIIFYVQSDHPRMLLVLVHSFFDTYSFLLQHRRWSKIIVIVKVNIIFVARSVSEGFAFKYFKLQDCSSELYVLVQSFFDTESFLLCILLRF